MFTQIFKSLTGKRAAVLTVALLVTGCTGGGLGILFGGNAPTRLALPNSGVTLVAPAGYCIDARSVQDDAQRVFALMGSCASLTGNANNPKPASRGLITATLGPALALQRSVNSAALAEFVESEPGQSALGHSDQGGNPGILASITDERATFLQLNDGTVDQKSGLNPVYWRAFLFVGDRLTTLSLYTYGNAPLGEQAAVSTLRTFSQRLQAEN